MPKGFHIYSYGKEYLDVVDEVIEIDDDEVVEAGGDKVVEAGGDKVVEAGEEVTYNGGVENVKKKTETTIKAATTKLKEATPAPPPGPAPAPAGPEEAKQIKAHEEGKKVFPKKTQAETEAEEASKRAVRKTIPSAPDNIVPTLPAPPVQTTPNADESSWSWWYILAFVLPMHLFLAAPAVYLLYQCKGMAMSVKAMHTVAIFAGVLVAPLVYLCIFVFIGGQYFCPELTNPPPVPQGIPAS